MDLEADLAPLLTDELEHVILIRTHVRGLDQEFHWPAVRQQARAALVAPIQAQLVKQTIRGPGIVREALGPELILPERALGQDRVVRRGGEAEVEKLVDRATVEAERQGVTEALVPEQAPPDGVAGVQVQVEGQVRCPALLPQQRAQPAAPLAGFEEGIVLHGEMPSLQVGLARRS